MVPPTAFSAMLKRSPLLLALVAGCIGPVWAAPQDAEALFDLSIEELSRITVVSASRSAERLLDAPATVIVLTQDDLRQRGYRELSEIYDDLPGMDLSRAYGDTYYRNQWRGIRKSIGTPYLLLLDGLVMNHLYFNQEEVITTLPLSQIDRVEIVYGPGSVVYGANAFVGVINVISRHKLATDGSKWQGKYQQGSFDRRIGDAHFLHQSEEFRFSFAARWDEGELDQDANRHYEWLNPRYSSDRRLWGGFLDDPDRAGDNGSRHEHEAFDLRLYWRDTEIAAQYFSVNSQFGRVYPGDSIQSRSWWYEPDASLYLRQQHQFSERWRASTTLRYRESGVRDDSTTLEAYPLDAGNGDLTRVIDFSYWGTENHSFALLHDAEWQLDDQDTVVAGLKFERKDLQKAYRINFGPSLTPDQIPTLASYPWPAHATQDNVLNNRIEVDEFGLYGQWRRRWLGVFGDNDEHIATAGARWDKQTEYGEARTLRGGYVLQLQPWTFKLLYGESYNEPAPRELYGGWRGSGSDPTLEPETGKTLEASLHYTGEVLSGWLSSYQMESSNDIITFGGGALNAGKRAISGVDANLRWHLLRGTPYALQTWAYYSYIDAEEERFLNSVSTALPVGDTAEHKFYLGLTWLPRADLSVTLRGRHIGSRTTVPTNPIREVPRYTSWDLNALWSDIMQSEFSLALTITNASDTVYYHPGLREADAGTTPGFFDGDGVWQGSNSFYNSLMPQDGRGYFLSLYLDW